MGSYVAISTLATIAVRTLRTGVPAVLLAAALLIGNAQVVRLFDTVALAPCLPGAVARLYLGQSSVNGNVSDEQWRAFVDTSVSPRFPAGFTELKGHGHWRDARGATLEEETRILEVAHGDSADERARIRAIAVDYRRRFAQQSVLITQLESLQCLEAGDGTVPPRDTPSDPG